MIGYRMRRFAFAGIIVNAAMIAIRVSSYRELLALPGIVPFIAKPLIVLVIYFVAVTWMTANVTGERAVALAVGPSFGLLTAAVQIVHLLIESFVTTEASVTGITALVFMLATRSSRCSTFSIATISAIRRRRRCCSTSTERFATGSGIPDRYRLGCGTGSSFSRRRDLGGQIKTGRALLVPFFF
jgi:hypothetical protein